MKIFSAPQIKACDAYTIHAEGISSSDLVERAANACATHIRQYFSTDTPFVFLCGMGNNGADGLALARILMQYGYGIKVFVIQHRDQGTPEYKSNLNQILKVNAALVDYVAPESFLADFHPQVVIIDAILGVGLSRPIQGWLADFFAHINQLPNFKIAIDVPSGLPADNALPADHAVMRVNETLSFQFLKRGFLHAETAGYAGLITLLDIGLHPTFIEATHTHYSTIESPDMARLITPRDPFTYKNRKGHLFVAAGSKGKTGALILSSKAALRSGAGLVTGIIPEACYHAYQSSVPEAMCIVAGDDTLNDFPLPETATACVLGMGMGTDAATAEAFAQFMATCELPCVFDADALNLLAAHPDLLHKIPERSVLTPHVGECDRLFGVSQNSMQRVEHVRMQAMRYKVCIVLKGRYTVIATPEGDCFYNTTGNAGMAKAGSGDVLSGLIGGLLAKGHTAVEAALLGVHLHGIAGDIAAGFMGQEAMNAGDLVLQLPAAWQKLAKM
ncbi:NAD(P)H-hydrate dehydratase [Rurimicrobium arvi]|uniref:Bifunctional NAD(P)H-hydrate repair enzyme n=1 Tax=Rurimicrobium arvi TaxID=2049916 RepID=A0ABP8MHB2_9BACT